MKMLFNKPPVSIPSESPLERYTCSLGFEGIQQILGGPQHHIEEHKRNASPFYKCFYMVLGTPYK